MSDWVNVKVSNVAGEERELRFPNTKDGRERAEYFKMRAKRDKLEAEEVAAAAAEKTEGRQARAAEEAVEKPAARSAAKSSE